MSDAGDVSDGKAGQARRSFDPRGEARGEAGGEGVGGRRWRARELVQVTAQGFLFNPTDGESYTVNRTGAELLRALLDGADSRAAWRRLCETFDVDERSARRDADDFLARLVELDLLEEVSDDEGAKTAGGAKGDEASAAEATLRAAAGPSSAR